jgi:hypothetical protein
MEIGPVTSVRPLPVPQFKGFDNQLPAVFEVEYLGRTGDETYSSNSAKSAAGQDDDSGEPEDLEQEEPSAPVAANAIERQISFFA